MSTQEHERMCRSKSTSTRCRKSPHFELCEADSSKKFRRFTELSLPERPKLLFSISNTLITACALLSLSSNAANPALCGFTMPKSFFNSFPPLRIAAEASILMKSRKTFQEISHEFTIAIVWCALVRA
jgi:hypothetical protein